MTKAYPAYKDSGVEWLGEVPERWVLQRLRFVATLNPSKSELAGFDRAEEVSFIPMEAVGENGELDTSRTRPIAEVETGYTYLRNGDMTFAKITPCFENGKRAMMRDLIGGIGFGTTELTVLRPRVGQSTTEYLFWLLSSPSFRKTGEAFMYGAGGQKRVPDDFVRDFTVPLPPLPEQTAIAAFLDRETAKIDALVAEQRQLIDLLREKRQAVISHAVTKGLNPAAPLKPSGIDWLGDVPEGWEVGPIKRFVKFLDGKRIPLSSEERGLRSGDFPYYGASGVIDWIDDYIFDEDLVLVSEDGANLLARASPIAFVASGRYWVNNHAHILKPNDGEVIYWSERIEQIDLTPYVTGSAQPKLTVDALANITVSAPMQIAQRSEIALKIRIARERFDPVIATAESVIALLQERRAALISAAVTGKIDVRPLSLQATEAA